MKTLLAMTQHVPLALSTLLLFAACGTSVAEPPDDGGADPACPSSEPSMLDDCTKPDLVCSYSSGDCTHELKCVNHQWSFESKLCNFPECPTDVPSGACTPLGSQCFYGQEPLPSEAPCENRSWAEALCDASTKEWNITWYDSICPPGCPTTAPSDGDPCNPELWAPECTYEVDTACGKATATATCAGDAPHHTWSVSTPSCP